MFLKNKFVLSLSVAFLVFGMELAASDSSYSCSGCTARQGMIQIETSQVDYKNFLATFDGRCLKCVADNQAAVEKLKKSLQRRTLRKTTFKGHYPR